MTAIPIDLDAADRWLATARELQDSDKMREASLAIEQAYRAAPQAPRVWHFAALHRMRQQDYRWALDTLALVHEAVQDAPEPCYHAGLCAIALGEYGAAKSWLQRATRRFPRREGAAAWQVLGSLYAMHGQPTASRNAYQRCVECDGTDPDDRFNQALVYLLRRDWTWGFDLYEARHEIGLSRQFKPHAASGLPRWTGIEPGRVLVVSEQGTGDSIMMERYLGHIPDCVASVQPELVTWFRNRGHRVVSNREALPEADYQVPMMSLPSVFGVLPPARGEHFGMWEVAASIRRHTPRVGICWAGNPAHTNDRDRSMPQSLRSAMSSLCEYEWVNLTFGQGYLAESWQATAELMETLDAVVTVDTAVAHMAGTLGIPTICLIPSAPEWRWGLEGDTTPFYPSMQLVRRKRYDDWPAAIEEAAERLRGILG